VTDTNLGPERTSTILSRLESLQLTIQPLLDDVPDSNEDDDAFIRILEQLAAAKTVEDLQAPWDSNGLKQYVDQSILVTAIRKSPSRFPGGFSHFLVLDATLKDGERVVTTTSSGSIVVQLLKVRSLGQLPVLCIPRAAKTAKGYDAMHLEFPLAG
jgi:hypothetical protein